MKALIYVKDNCIFCQKAKEVFDKYDIEYTINDDWSIDELKNIANSEQPTVPQIFLDDEYIGGFTDLIKHLSK